jgi:glycerol-3-phosphate O-acyltransferase
VTWVTLRGMERTSRSPDGGATGPEIPTMPELYRSGMRRRFGLLYHLSGLAFMLRRLKMEDHSADQVRRAAERGPVVYVLHSRSRLDWLALNRVLNGRRLPLPQFTSGIHSTVFAPLAEAVREWFDLITRRLRSGPLPHPVTSGWLGRALAAGIPTALFLLPGRDIRSTLRGRGRPQPHLDPVPSLLGAQTIAQRPIQLVPVVVAWQRRPEAVRGAAARFLLGSQDEPSALQKLVSVLARNPWVVVHAGEPIDLRELRNRFADDPPARQARRVRLLLRRYLWRESHVVRGPRIRAHRWTRRLVLQSPEIRELIATESARTGKPAVEVEYRVEKIFDRMAARIRFNYVRITANILHFIWNRIFSGVDIREEDLERIRSAYRGATPVLVPCHRSHLDYLLISSHFYDQDMAVPHIVAGENLAFFPMAHVFRSMGAFFIKRQFAGDPLFPTVFARYLHQLIRDGFPIEFFIEGGRSRTGKLLPPRLGVLGMILDSAAKHREGWDVKLLPIAIAYEQIAEAGIYARELSGATKPRETIGQLVKAGGGILRNRFGRVYLRVGEPIPVSEIFAKLDRPWLEVDADHRSEIVQHTGERIMARISRNMVVLPSGLVATALLAQSRRSITRIDLQARVDRLYAALQEAGALFGHSLESDGLQIDATLNRFCDEKLVGRLTVEADEIYRPIDDQRIKLEYHKNGVLHHLTPMSLLAAAIRACRSALPSSGTMDPAHPMRREISRLFSAQVFLLRYEFTLDPERSLAALEQQARIDLVRYGALADDGAGGIAVANRELVVEVAELTRNFLESYQLTLRAAQALRTRDVDKDSLTREVQELGKRLLMVDEIRRSEALSRANIKNAVRAFREEGAIQIHADGSGIEFDAAVCEGHARDLTALLR